jgi:peptidoglycan hydrolase-like protein with peptidoglycan-binding domain
VRRLPSYALITLFALAAPASTSAAAPAAGGGVAYAKAHAAPRAGGEAAPASADEVSVGVFFLAGEQFTRVSRTVHPGATIVAQTIASLLAGPTKRERSRLKLDTAIPPGAALVSSHLLRPGIAELRFNAAFAGKSSPGQSTGELKRETEARVFQVVYTVTSLTGVDKVRIAYPGQPTFTLDRTDFEAPKTVAAPKVQTKASGPSPKDPRSVQRALVRMRYLPAAAITGRFDYRTQQAVIAFQAWEGLGRDGIVGPITAGRLAKAGVPRPKLSAGGRRAEVYRDRGVVLLILDNSVFRVLHTSTGKGGDSSEVGTPPGSFKVMRKERNSWSKPFQVNLPYAVYFNRGIAFHGYDSVPAYPASHGCARLPQQEAPVVYAFLQTGDRVDVF